jgi:lysozyme
MRASQNCIDLVKKFEGCFLKAYRDPIGIWTIGYGIIVYPDGKKVMEGDVITGKAAEYYLTHELNIKAIAIEHHFFNVAINQNQFDALLSFTYNLGVGALAKSTLLKKVKYNHNDPTIRGEFMKWVKAGGKVLKGLQLRRAAEADLYFT